MAPPPLFPLPPCSGGGRLSPRERNRSQRRSVCNDVKHAPLTCSLAGISPVAELRLKSIKHGRPISAPGATPAPHLRPRISPPASPLPRPPRGHAPVIRRPRSSALAVGRLARGGFAGPHLRFPAFSVTPDPRSPSRRHRLSHSSGEAANSGGRQEAGDSRGLFGCSRAGDKHTAGVWCALGDRVHRITFQKQVNFHSVISTLSITRAAACSNSSCLHSLQSPSLFLEQHIQCKTYLYIYQLAVRNE